jgi:integrase
MSNTPKGSAPARKGRGRPATGQLELRPSSGYWVRLTVTIDGERVRKWFALDTHDKSVAKLKASRMAKQAGQGVLNVHAAASEGKRVETYQEAAARVRTQRELEGRKAVSDERIHDTLYLCPVFGEMPVTAIRPAHIRDALEAARETGKSQKTLANIRGSASIVFEELWRSEVIEENPVKRAPFVRAQVDRRERAVLTDEELVVYLGWRHPDERFDVFVAQRQTMSLVSRLLGGARVGDLHSITWQSFDLEDFAFGWVPRNKTERPQRMHIDPVLRPYLAAWHQRMGSPREGLVFPRLIGAGAGELGKPGSSYAEELRRDLKRAMGLETCVDGRWVVTVDEADYTPRQRELYTETRYTKPVDFHSWRRAFNQALADAGLNAQQAAALAGHSSLEVHSKYLRNTAKAATLPQSAVPKLAAFRQRTRPEISDESLKSQDENWWRRRESKGAERRAVLMGFGMVHAQNGRIPWACRRTKRSPVSSRTVSLRFAVVA